VCRGERILCNIGLSDSQRVRKRKGEEDVDKMVCGRIGYLACMEYHCGSFQSTFSFKVIPTRTYMQRLRDFAYRSKPCKHDFRCRKIYVWGHVI
jgi:hypothetical protein